MITMKSTKQILYEQQYYLPIFQKIINFYKLLWLWRILIVKKRKILILTTSFAMWFSPYIVQIYHYVHCCCYFDFYRLQEFLGERGRWGARLKFLTCFIFQVNKLETFNFKTQQHVHDLLCTSKLESPCD
jgi:hypothetical protein